MNWEEQVKKSTHSISQLSNKSSFKCIQEYL